MNTILDIDKVSKELEDEKKSKGKQRINYKVVSDEHKNEVVSADILEHLTGIQESVRRGKVNFSNLEEVQQRTYDYFVACANAKAFPSVMGLATRGYGISRQALNQYLIAHDNETTDFIKMVRDNIADILTNESLNNNINPVQTIFQLKNHFQHTDSVTVETNNFNNLAKPLDLQTILNSLPSVDDASKEIDDEFK